MEAPDGFRVIIRRSKTDQEGEEKEVAIPHGYKIRPVEAVQAWLAEAEISSGPVFRPVLKGGRLQVAAMRKLVWELRAGAKRLVEMT